MVLLILALCAVLGIVGCGLQAFTTDGLASLVWLVCSCINWAILCMLFAADHLRPQINELVSLLKQHDPETLRKLGATLWDLQQDTKTIRQIQVHDYKQRQAVESDSPLAGGN